MKRSMTLALLVLAAIVCVVATGCGSRKDQSTTNDTMNGTTSSSGTTSSNGSANGSTGSGGSASGSGGAIGSTMEGVGDAITGSNGSGSGSGSGGSGSGSTSNHYASSGVPYDQMLDNGKVTDHDGNLNNDPAARGR